MMQSNSRHWSANTLLIGWAAAAMCAAISHLFLPEWTANGTSWASEVHWQREIAYFDLLLAAALLWVANQRDISLKLAACAGISCLSLALGLQHLSGWLTAPKIFHIVFTLGNFLAVAWGTGVFLVNSRRRY